MLRCKTSSLYNCGFRRLQGTGKIVQGATTQRLQKNAAVVKRETGTRSKEAMPVLPPQR
jgi:hypothetical protein